MSALISGAPEVVVDNTNTTWLEAERYVRVARQFGYAISVVTLDCDPDTAAARNSHGVPVATVRRMAANLGRERLPDNVSHLIIRDRRTGVES